MPTSVLYLVDLHWSGDDASPLPELAGIDLVLLGGDLTHFKGVDTVTKLLAAIRDAGCDVMAVGGNCDPPELEPALVAADANLDRVCRQCEGVAILGLSAGLPFGGCPYERSEQQFADACNALVAARPTGVPTILVSHQPPSDTRCDFIADRDRHVGSVAVRCHIEDEQPDLVLCGHIHEGIGEDHIGASRIINPGPAFANHAVRFQLDAGRIADITIT